MTTMKLPDSPSGKQQYAFLPSALEHPRFTRYQGGRSSYMLCHKQVIDSVRERGSYKRFSPDGGMTVMHSLTGQQIGHILRVRVIQELQLLARRLLRVRRLAKPADPPLLRRLTRAEWNEIKATGVIPYRNAVAVLVVPPPNRDPETKERPTPVATSTPDLEDLEGKEPPKSLPISVLHPTFKEEQQWKDDPLSKIVPPSLVPLYNGVSLFPSRTQRAALHAALSEVLRAERTTRLMTGSQPALTGEVSSTTGGPARAKGDKKASHAILLCSDERTILRADTVPLAIALWRVRMWEGDIDEEAVVHWMAEPSRIP
ncbi:hypothetical protein BN946_scf184652.g2 [Trametes cinnabarina]|uniref:Uncharacterized protein n=1 Tax=Pycnoporus cinnabarinus TaxID=5643 RepID=A0A060S2X9_PYCCI|nr:hypothetical protein BN946_scf184652.g2 [Trametes cinnabarina]